MNITVCEKPNWISFEDIHDLLWVANEENRKAGFVLKTSTLSGKELYDYLGDDGQCYVALCDEKVVGTLSVRFVELDKWFFKGKIADFALIAVLPEYQGHHVLGALIEKGIKYTLYKECPTIKLDTAEQNIRAINAYKHFGFVPVGYYSVEKGDHNNIIMAKWLHKCPFNKTRILLEFLARKLFVRINYKKGKVKRFGIIG